MFAGIGGFRSGLTRAGGFQCVGHCEIDKYANASYQAIYEPGRRNDTIRTQPKLTPQTCRTSTCSVEDSPARHFLTLAADGALPTPEELSSLRLPDWLKQSDLRICCLKMFPAFYRMTKGKPFRSSSPHWMTWGTMSNGLCLTANVLESRNQDEGCSLSDILIPDAPGKYYLSSAQVEKLLYKSSEGRKAPGSMTQTE